MNNDGRKRSEDFDNVPVRVRNGENDVGLNVSSLSVAGHALMRTDQMRTVAEVQGMIIVAKMFPRNVAQCIEAIKMQCCRPDLAKRARYAYARGGTEISGPSIRLAEVLQQNWENFDAGIRELEQMPGMSIWQAYAWDKEKNTRAEMNFNVSHQRYTKKDGLVTLKDPRDIYELGANLGARRKRACILQLIPGDVVDVALDQCDITLNSELKGDLKERVKRMLDEFAAIGVNRDMIEKRIQRRVESILPAQFFRMIEIYNSLRDGMSKVRDWFEDSTVRDEPAANIPENIHRDSVRAAEQAIHAPAAPALNDAQGDMLNEISEILTKLAGNDPRKISINLRNWSSSEKHKGGEVGMIVELAKRPDLFDMVLERARITAEEAQTAQAENKNSGKLL